MVNSESQNGTLPGDNSPLPIPDIEPAEKSEDQPSSSNGVCQSQGNSMQLPAHAWMKRPELSEKDQDVFQELANGTISLRDAFLEIRPGYREMEPDHGFSDDFLMNMLVDIFETPSPRNKLAQYNTFEDAVELIRNSNRILVLTGAGVSVSCGIPDFRSKDGIYARLHKDFPDLPDPTAMFDIRYFDHNPQPFYNFAKEIFMGQFEPSLSHKFIRQLELSGKLLRNYTQNIDTLEKQTGIRNVIECHGSFSEATCRHCKAPFDGEHIREDVMAQRVARCPQCQEGVIKPNITFFGEDLPPVFHHTMMVDKDETDLVIVIGSSLKVGPVNAIPSSVPAGVPQILINREQLKGYSADIEILGNCDDILREFCYHLGEEYEMMVQNHDEKMKTFRPDYVSKDKKTIRLDHFKFEEIMFHGSKAIEAAMEDESLEENLDGPSAKRQKLSNIKYEKPVVSVSRKFDDPRYYFQTEPNVAIFSGSYAKYDRSTMRLCTMSDAIYSRKPPRDRVAEYMKKADAKKEREFSLDSSTDSSTGSDRSRGGSEPPELLARFEEIPLLRSASCEPAVDTETLLPFDEIVTTLMAGESSDSDDSDDDDNDRHSFYASAGGDTPKYEFPDDCEPMELEPEAP